MEEIWNKYKEENLQMSTYMFNLHEKEYKKMFFDAFSLAQKTENKEKINRVEVIQKDKGRVYANYNVKNCEIQEQDNGETLKIFLDYEK